MSELSYLEKLLDGVGVQWKTIGEVTSQTNNIKWREATRTYRYVDLTAVDIETKKITVTTEITANNAPSRAQKLLQENDVIFATTRPTQQRFCLIDSEHSGEVASTGYCVLRAKQDEVLPKWILHWISTRYFNEYVEENQSGSAYPAISDAKVKECLIPIPCPDNPEKSLAIQSEIVRILDTFTALTAELNAELNMRKKQYNYYRDQLLSFDESTVEWKTLLEACDYVDYRGKTPTKTQSGIFLVTAKNIRMGYIDYQASQEFISESDYAVVMRRGLPKKGDVLITTEAPCGFVAQVDRKNIALAQRVIKYRSKDSQLSNSFLKHYLLGSHFQGKLMKAATGSTVKGIKGSKLHQLKVPIPSKIEQARIVAILDKFDTLNHSITEGLPREIELRQKQYEYYRDMLFSFPNPEVAEA